MEKKNDTYKTIIEVGQKYARTKSFLSYIIMFDNMKMMEYITGRKFMTSDLLRSNIETPIKKISIMQNGLIFLMQIPL